MNFLFTLKAKLFPKSPDAPPILEEEPNKFGAFLGVFVPCILMLFGVIIFLRLGWIVGVVGASEALVIITLSALVTLITTFSK